MLVFWGAMWGEVVDVAQYWKHSGARWQFALLLHVQLSEREKTNEKNDDPQRPG